MPRGSSRGLWRQPRPRSLPALERSADAANSQYHIAGERWAVDDAGTPLEVVGGATGEAGRAQLFGASNLTCAEAPWSQGLSDWIGARCRAFSYLGGAQVVSDTLKSGVTKACFDAPAVNRTRADMAAPDGTAVVPARPRKPRDKARVEVAVRIAQRRIAARLHNPRFFSWAELNAAIRVLPDQLNDRGTRHLGARRRRTDRAPGAPALASRALCPLRMDAMPVGLDDHAEVDRHCCRVPHSLWRKKVRVRFTARTIGIFHLGKRVAARARISSNRTHTTVADHMPASHRRDSDGSPARLKPWAAKIGPDTAPLVAVILRDRSHPEQGLRSCPGIMRLARPWPRGAGSGLRAGAHDRGAVLLLGELDPEE